jgi:hypothetical protein
MVLAPAAAMCGAWIGGGCRIWNWNCSQLGQCKSNLQFSPLQSKKIGL